MSGICTSKSKTCFAQKSFIFYGPFLYTGINKKLNFCDKSKFSLNMKNLKRYF